jgi:hypothetical protein
MEGPADDSRFAFNGFCRWFRNRVRNVFWPSIPRRERNNRPDDAEQDYRPREFCINSDWRA